MFKKLHLENHCSRSVNIYTKDSLYGENMVAPRQKWGPRWVSKFKYIDKCLKIFSRTTCTMLQFAIIQCKHPEVM